MKFSRRLLVLVSLGALGVTLAAVGPAGASRSQSAQCKGTADYCGATVSLAGGATNRVVTVMLTDTNLELRGVWAVPTTASGAYKITKAAFRLGGSQYRFTLNARRGNPPRSRIVLLFTAGSRDVGIPGLQGHLEVSNAIFSVGAGKTVSITGGGGGTSLCTRDETVTTFTTKGNNESHPFGLFAKNDGSCYFDLSFSQFRVTIKDSAGKLVGSGIMFLGQRYVFNGFITSCDYAPWVGATCKQTNPDRDTFSDLKITL
jgi:hypothetical protein